MTVQPPCLQPLIEWYAALTPASLAQLPQFYTEHCHFQDPFNTLHSQAAVQRLYAHMFAALEQPRFLIRRSLLEGDQAVLVWDMQFRWRGRDWCIAGASHLAFAADGRVCRHRDYWDAAGALYEKLPLLGALLRRLRKALQAPESA